MRESCLELGRPTFPIWLYILTVCFLCYIGWMYMCMFMCLSAGTMAHVSLLSTLFETLLTVECYILICDFSVTYRLWLAHKLLGVLWSLFPIFLSVVPLWPASMWVPSIQAQVIMRFCRGFSHWVISSAFSVFFLQRTNRSHVYILLEKQEWFRIIIIKGRNYIIKSTVY